MSEPTDGKNDPAQWAALEARAQAAHAEQGILDICWLCPEDNPLEEYGWRPSGTDQAKYPNPPDQLAAAHPEFSALLTFATEAGRCFDPNAADSAGAWLKESVRRWPSDRTGTVYIDLEGTGELVRFRTGTLMDVWALFVERCAELAGKRRSHWSGVFSQARAGVSAVSTAIRSPSPSEQAEYESLRSQAKTPGEWLKLDDERRAGAQKPAPPPEPGYPSMIENENTGQRIRVDSAVQAAQQVAEWGVTVEEARWAAGGRQGPRPNPEPTEEQAAGTDSPEAAEGSPAKDPEPSSEEVAIQGENRESAATRWRPGPRPAVEIHAAVRKIIDEIVPAGVPWIDKLDEISEAMDNSTEPRIPIPPSWPKTQILRSWSDAAATNRDLAIKTIKYRLSRARRDN
ncbi:MAG: hypothetical protein LAP61_23030 [Acidobacteriia bacterium]|nr:hypothetical protein [Terriglobia bacterium]